MDTLLLADQVTSPVAGWLPVVLLLVIAVLFAAGNVALSLFLGPKRTGPAKETTYESGVLPVGNARQRFNVRFYIVAMIFLVFDVEIVFLYPWASIFAKHIKEGNPHTGAMLLMEMIVFVAILLVAYLYAWGKGVFRWD